MFYTIYRITNTVNGKIYIGKHQTNNLDDGYFGSGKILKQAIKKYGKEKFTKEILHVFETEEEMNDKEKELVVIGESSYNLCPGGQGGWGYLNYGDGRKYNKRFEPGWQRSISPFGTDAFISKHREDFIKGGRTHKGMVHSEKTKEKLRAANIGKSRSQEFKELRSKQQQGSNNNQYGTIWVTNGQESIKIKSTDPIPEHFYKGRVMSKIGTKDMMRGWLQDHKHLTYSTYSALPTEKKLAIQSEYQKKGTSKKG